MTTEEAAEMTEKIVRIVEDADVENAMRGIIFREGLLFIAGAFVTYRAWWGLVGAYKVKTQVFD